MVIQDPMSDEEKEEVKEALEEVLGGSVSIDETSTAEGSFDYEVSGKNTATRKMRNFTAKVKYHESEDDWEVDANTGAWLS